MVYLEQELILHNKGHQTVTHELKIWPKYYARVNAGTKTFEVRNNDRDFQAGDTVLLDEWNPESKCYTDNETLEFKIGYVLPIEGEKVVFSLLSL